MLGNVLLKTLRDHRWGILGWGLGLGLIMAFVVVEYQQFVGNLPQQDQFLQAYKTFGFLIGEVVPINTLGGFLTLETIVYGAALLGAWAALTGVAMTRGEEERGALDVLLSTPQGRRWVFAQKTIALGVGILAAIALIGILFAAGLFSTGQSLPAGAVVAVLFNVAVAAAFWGATGLLVGQLVARRRVASTVVGSLIIGTYLLNSTAETVSSLKDLVWVTPFHYYNMSKPLVPGRALDWTGVLVLLAATMVLLVLATWLFTRRDAGVAVALMSARRGAPLWPGGRKESLILFDSVFAKSLRDLGMPTLGWGVGLASYCAMMVATTREALAPMYTVMNQLPWFTKLFGSMITNESYLSVGIFLYLPLLLILFALTQVSGWASDEEDGRLELLLSEPVPRWQVAIARYGTVTLSLAVILALIAIGMLGTAAFVDVKLDSGRIVQAVLATAPLVLVALAFGLVLATWLARPGPAVGITSALVVLMFFISTLAPLFDWPEAVQRLSIFRFYGRPAVDGIIWTDMGLLMAAVLLLAMASLVGFQRRDIVK